MHFENARQYPSGRSPVFARNIVTTSHPLATQAGLAMLKIGGNAVDAALAAAIALPVVEPTGNGLGSDAFAIIWDGKELHGLNASGRSPAAWTSKRFAGLASMPQRGWESVTVPGAVSAWRDLSAKFGRLPFEKLFEPAIDYARHGHHVAPIIAEQWRRGGELLKDKPGFAEAFLPGGRAPKAGELFRSPAMAKSLELIARTKGAAFYRGELAQSIAAFAAAHGAALTLDDLAAHKNEWCGTIKKTFGNTSLCEIPPNGQGIAALMALGIVQETDIARHDPDSADAIHIQIEAMKLAFMDIHAFVADGMSANEVTESHLLNQDYLASRAALIDKQKAKEFATGAPTAGGTVCLAAADADGMMVSYIQSNYSGFGSGVVVPDTGISLQNRGFGFTLEEGHPNQVAPRKRPFHTIIPGFVMQDDEPLMAFGLMGGPMQAQGHLQMMLRTQLWKQDPQSASDAPRWRVLKGLDVALEDTTSKEVVHELERRGHQVSVESPDASFGFGGAQIIHRIEGGYVAGSDHRKDGCAGGY
ncbi:gamma-glutamyltransferase family protein [Limoniibacter endophyticus]|uniref:Gamma-glutamyltransferase n=1 Tax=Limoniibacter endophyticus TaxID=1565040 RepID=A0A8J3DKN9_9HYPH|nr:gamma-glutamyltransferase family protein [Limoniibacter endophyticus]GHC78276.1 gamma-glutamyltransferase [Limoniibacter endophyticus]